MLVAGEELTPSLGDIVIINSALSRATRQVGNGGGIFFRDYAPPVFPYYEGYFTTLAIIDSTISDNLADGWQWGGNFFL